MDLGRVVPVECNGWSPVLWIEFPGSVVAGGGGFVFVVVWKHVSVTSWTCSN